MTPASRKWLGILAVTVLCALAAACGGGKKPSNAASGGGSSSSAASSVPSSATASKSAAPATSSAKVPKRAAADLVIWADGQRAPILRKLAQPWAARNGIKVAVQEVDFSQLTNDLVQAAPSGQGPDIIIDAHNVIGQFVKDGLIDPISLGSDAKNYSQTAISGCTYQQQLYCLPYAVENVALFTNTQMVPHPPTTWAQLESTALQLKREHKAAIPLALPESAPGAAANPYQNYGLFSALGGYVFGKTAKGQYDPNKLGIDSPGAVKAGDAFAKWAKEGLISLDVSSSVADQDFAAGKTPFAIEGPWALSTFDAGKVKGHYTVGPIPPIDGGTPHVFLGVQAFMVSHFAKNKTLANTFLLDVINSKSAMDALFQAGQRPSAYNASYAEEASQPVVKGFHDAGAAGEPMPALPQMADVWGPWTNAYVLIMSGREDAGKALKDAASQIRASF